MSHNFGTNIKYLDFLILNYLDDTSLCQLFKTDIYWAQKGNNDQYFQFRIQMYYGPEVVSNKPTSLTFKQQYLDIIEILYRSGFIGADEIKCSRLDLILVTHRQHGRIPGGYIVKKCLEYGQIDTIKYILTNYGDLETDISRGLIINQLLEYGHLDLLDSLVHKYQIFPTINSFTQAFQTLSLIILKRLYSTYKLRPEDRALAFAMSRGEKEMILWLINEFGMIPRRVHLFRALISDQVETWYWLTKQYNIRPTTHSVNHIIALGHFDLARRVMSEFDLSVSDTAANVSIGHNNVKALQWLDQCYSIRPSALTFLSNVNNMDAVRFVVTKWGYQPSVDDADMALDRNLIEQVKYFYANFQLLSDENIFTYVDLLPNSDQTLEVFKFLLEVKPQWVVDQETVNKTARIGNLKLCQLLYEKSDLYPDKKSCDFGWKCGAVAIYSWLSKVQNDTRTKV